MNRKFSACLLSILIFFFLVLPLAAQGAQAETAKTSPKMKFYFWERIRQESWDNTMSLNDSGSDSSAYLRLRSSLGSQWRPNDTWEVNLRLTNENRLYLAPKSDPKLKKNYDFNEVFVDQLNVRWKNPGRLPLTITFGRQDMMFGEGFLVMDGGPLDGSRSVYFNGLKLDYRLKENNSLTFFFVRQPRTDTLLPVVNDKEQPLVEQEEQGFGFYFSGRAKETGIEAYLFRKDVFAIGGLPDGKLFIAGGRVAHPFTTKLFLTAEGAVQLGTLGQENRRGLGGYFHLDHKSGWRFPLPVQLTLGGIYLSGDDPTTRSCEGWDPAFSRWPKWSDSLIYLQAKETLVADWTNFTSIYGLLFFEPAEKVKLSLAWHSMAAPARWTTSALLAGQGKNRGGLFIAKITYDVSKNLSGRFIWENFNPDDFYAAGSDSYNWIQFELFFRF